MKILLVAIITLGLLTSQAFGQGGGGRQRGGGGGRQGPPATPSQGTPAAPKTLPTTPTATQLLKTKMKAELAAVRDKGQVTPELKKEFVADLLAAARGTAKPSPASVERLADDLLGAIAVQNIAASSKAKTVLTTNTVKTVLATNAVKTATTNAAKNVPATNVVKAVPATGDAKTAPATNAVKTAPVTSDANPALAANDTKIVDNLVVAVNSVGLSAARLQEIANDLQSALSAEGVALDTAAIVADDLKALVAEVQEAASK